VDDRLRDLEQAARRDPSDAGAGLAYARALGRSGQDGARRRELGRLGRAGVLAAWLELEPAPPAGLRGEPARVRRAHLRGPALQPLGPLEGGARLLAHDPYGGTPGLVGLDLEALDVAWRVPVRDEAPAAPLGADAVLVVGGEEDAEWALARIDGATGAERARTPLPRPEPAAEAYVAPYARDVLAAGDRVLVDVDLGDGADTRLLCLASEPWGAPVWTATLASAAAPAVAAGGLVLESGFEVVEARALADGAPSWRTPARGVLAADPRGALLVGGRDPAGATLLAVDPRGHVLWRSPELQPHGLPVVLTAEAFVTTRLARDPAGASTFALVARSRTDGALRWATPPTRGAPDALAASRDAVYVLWGVSAGLGLAAYDLAGGERLFEVVLETERRPRPGGALLLALDGALVLGFADGEGTRLVRLEGDA